MSRLPPSRPLPRPPSEEDEESRYMRRGLLSEHDGEVDANAVTRSQQAPRRSADAANGMHAVDVPEDAAAQQQAAAKLKASSELNSLNFDPVNNPHFVDSGRRPPRGILGYSGKTFARWFLTVLIGVAVALAARILSFGVEKVAGFRNSVLQSYFDDSEPDWKALSFFVLYNAGLVTLAAVLTTYIEPSAAAGGIPEIQAYLNGTHVHNFLRLRTVAIKIFGTILSVGSGLACGQEGPMIHIGAGIASGMTRGEKLYRKFLCFELDTPKRVKHGILNFFRNDRDRREFICAGAGAGMAAAFGAPVGGVLFALEEAASHWSPELIWRVFTCTLIATFTLAFVKAGENSGDISLAGLLSFGTVRSVGDMKREIMNDDGTINVSAVDAPVYWWELVFFGLVGIGGGVLGGIWDMCFNEMAGFRQRYLTRRPLKVLEAVIVSIITSTTVFLLAYSFPMCRNNGSWTCKDADNWGEWCGGAFDNSTCTGAKASCYNASGWVCSGGGYNGKACRGRGDCEWRGGVCLPVQAEEAFGVRLGCPIGQYDELATMFFGTREHSIVRLITQAFPHIPFSNNSLIIVGFTYFVLMLLTYGCSFPAGLFMPSVLVGAAFGRCVGQLVKMYVDSSVFSGAYALAGAAAMLGGVQRATISLIVIIIEGTANVHFLLPIVVTTVTAKFVGNLFGHEGVYEIGLRRKKLRFLPHEPHWMMDLCTAGDAMTHPVVSLQIIDTVENITKALQSCNHSGFPVLALQNEDERGGRGQAGGKGRLEGIILRAQLQAILGVRFAEESDSIWQRIAAVDPRHVPIDGEPALYESMSSSLRPTASQDWEWGNFTSHDLKRYINIGAYMNAAPYFVHESCPMSRSYSIFRNMGLRHLPVVDVQNQVVGMLTRANFSMETVNHVVKSFYREEDIRQQDFHETRTPRLRGLEQLARQGRREPLPTADGKLVGGVVLSWQSRLAGLLHRSG